MALILTLVLGTLGARVVGWIGVDYVDTWPKAIAVGLAAAMRIGLEIAKGLAQAGADVVATGRRMDLVRAAAKEIKALGRRSLEIPCDVTDESTIKDLLKAACGEFGSVHILVNCAGRTKRTPTIEISDAEWNGIMETNLTGTLRACRVIGRHMIERGYGRIINIA